MEWHFREKIAQEAIPLETQRSISMQTMLLRVVGGMSGVNLFCFLFSIITATELAAQQQTHKGSWEVFGSIGRGSLLDDDDSSLGNGMTLGAGIGFQAFPSVGFEIEVHRVHTTRSHFDGGLFSPRILTATSDTRAWWVSGKTLFYSPSEALITHSWIRPFMLGNLSLLRVDRRRENFKYQPLVGEPQEASSERERSVALGIGPGIGLKMIVRPQITVDVRGEATLSTKATILCLSAVTLYRW